MDYARVRQVPYAAIDWIGGFIPLMVRSATFALRYILQPEHIYIFDCLSNIVRLSEEGLFVPGLKARHQYGKEIWQLRKLSFSDLWQQTFLSFLLPTCWPAMKGLLGTPINKKDGWAACKVSLMNGSMSTQWRWNWMIGVVIETIKRLPSLSEIGDWKMPFFLWLESNC